MKPWTGARNYKYMKYHSKLTYQLSFWNVSRKVDYHAGGNTLRPRQDGCRNDIFKCIYFNENVLILIKISLKFVPKVQSNNIPALVQIMAWRRPGDKPLTGPVMISSLLTHKCVTRPQCVDWVPCKLVKFNFLTLVMVTYITNKNQTKLNDFSLFKTISSRYSAAQQRC